MVQAPAGAESPVDGRRDSFGEAVASARAAAEMAAASAQMIAGAPAPFGAGPGVAASSGEEPEAEDPPPPYGSTDVQAEKLRDVNAVYANRATLNVVNIHAPPAESEKEKVAALLEITTEFQPDDRRHVPLDDQEVARHARVIENEGLLLVGCVNRAVARAAVQAVVDALGLEPGRARLLNFERLGTDQPAITVHGLLQCEGDTGTGTVVVADGLSARAQPFLDSLLVGDGGFSATYVRRTLRQRKLRLVCLADPYRYEPLARAGDDAEFTHWTLPFLEPFLRRDFPDDHETLLTEIMRQRDQGRWSRDDAEMWHQVGTFAEQRRLREVVEAGGVPREQPVVVDEQRPIHQTVLFAGAYCTALSPADFDRVVTALLEDETIPVPLPGVEGESPAAYRERPLTQLWREGSDRIMRECGLAVLRDPAAGQVVKFREPGTRAALRMRLEDEYPFHLNANFGRLHRTGLLFTGSDGVAANVVRATADMAETFPETYGRDWVSGIFLGNPLPDGEPAIARHVERRFGELLRELSARPAVRPVVDGVLGLLEFRTVLALVKQLRFAPEFDALRWLRQLIDRGNLAAREAAYAFLYRDLMAVGEQVYPTLHILAEWLPAEDADTGRYSPSQRYVLRLLVEYAANTAARFKPEHYGEWPVRYPLLATGPDTARRDLALLVRCLLHPGISEAVRDESDRPGSPRLVAALIAEWTFILFGSHESPVLPATGGAPPFPGTTDAAAEGRPAADAGDGGISPERLFTILMEELAARTRTAEHRGVRREMLGYWAEMDRLHLPSGRADRNEREELAWKRRLFRSLLLRFRALQTTPAAAAAIPDP
jgi:hypothetical protein